MASANSTFTEMVTTTLREHPTAVADNLSDHNALYRRMKTKGNIKALDGGYEIVRPLDYAENSTFQRYSGFDTLNIQASDGLSAAKYDWVQSAVHVVANGRELRQNAGKNQLIGLASSRTKTAMRTAANNMSVDIYSSGSLSNQMGGLGHLIQTDGGGTVGGIVSTTYTFWKNQFLEMTDTPSKSTMKTWMNKVWLLCVRGADKPDLLVASHDFYSFYWESLQDLQRYADSDKATAGFNALKFVSADIIFDSNSNFSTTAEKIYYLNTDYLELVEHKEARWTTLDEKMSVNQDGVVIPIIWMGQMVCSNRSLQGVLIDAV
jgi:hypothetical protein